MIELFARSASLVLAVLLCFAVAHKLRVLRRGEAKAQPLLRDRAGAGFLLAALAGVELLTAAALVVRPAAGLVVLMALLLVYTWELRRLAPGEPCGCFGELLDQTDRAVQRNLVLLAVAAAAATAFLMGLAEAGELTQADVGVAAVVLAAVVARAALERQFNTEVGGAR